MSGKANNRSGHESNHESGQKIVIERAYDASIKDVWALWTTREGIESWWGPEGFHKEIRGQAAINRRTQT